MDPVQTIQGNAIPLDRANVDTDAIIPAKYLKRIERSGYGPFAFEAWRDDPNFILNNPAYEGAPILLAGDNFGCGSSREHAVWAIQQMGVGAVISSSFADIFRNNSAKMGLLTVVLERADVEYLLARAEELPGAQITVDLRTQTVSTGEGWERRFEMDPFVKENLLLGQDDISLTLKHEPEIGAFELDRPSYLPAHSE